MTYRQAMDKAAKDYLTQLMRSVGGNICQAALRAEYDRAHFYKLLKRHGLNYWDCRPRVGRPCKRPPVYRRSEGPHEAGLFV